MPCILAERRRSAGYSFPAARSVAGSWEDGASTLELVMKPIAIRTDAVCSAITARSDRRRSSCFSRCASTCQYVAGSRASCEMAHAVDHKEGARFTPKSLCVSNTSRLSPRIL